MNRLVGARSPPCAPPAPSSASLSAAAFGAMAIFGKLAYDAGVGGRRPAARPLRDGRRRPARASPRATGALRGLAARRGARGAGHGRGRLRDAGRPLLPRARADGRVAAGARPLHVPGVRAGRRGRARPRAGDAAARRSRSSPPRPAPCSCSPARRGGAVDALGVAMGLGAALAYTRTSSSATACSRARRRSRSPRSSAPARRSRSARRARRRAGPELALRRRRAGAGSRAIALVSTVGAVIAFFAGLERVGPSAAAILSTLEPVVTVGLAAAAFGESLAGSSWSARARARAVVVMQLPSAPARPQAPSAAATSTAAG